MCLGAVVIKIPVVQLLQLHSSISSNGCGTFGYEFQKKRSSKTQIAKSPDWLRTGANHVDEIPYVFGYPLLPLEKSAKLAPLVQCKWYWVKEKLRNYISHTTYICKTSIILLQTRLSKEATTFEMLNYTYATLCKRF